MALYYKPFISKALRYGRWPVCSNGITQFYLPPTDEAYLPLLPSLKASPSFGWYSLRLPTKGWPGWVDLGGWSHTEINVPVYRELHPDTVTVPSTSRARRRLTSLMCATALPLSQTAVEKLTESKVKGQSHRNVRCRLLWNAFPLHHIHE